MDETFSITLGNNDTNTRQRANSDFVSFWDEQAKKLHWFKQWDKTLDWDSPPFAKWFTSGRINASYNALDVHQNSRFDKPAILWEGENGDTRKITYGNLLVQVQKFANVLRSLGISSGDRVAIYLPMIPEAIVSVLACARIGAIHTVIFSGFSSASVRDRVTDSKSKIVITADGGFRRGSVVRLKDVVDEAVSDLDFVEHVVVVERTGTKISSTPRDKMWNLLMDSASENCKAVELSSTHPLYILYTSGTTGKPKGVLHGTGGYLVHLHSTFKWAFDIRDSDVYFCTADIGWVTGHSYVAYGPLLHGATQVIYEGAPDFPDAKRIWAMLQRYGVTIFYTTPTALRMFMKFGDAIPDSFDLSALRLLGSVGEPINPSVWRWYFEKIGKSRCPIVDTWWQTETGGMLISPLPGLETIRLKPGSGTKPIPGVSIRVVNADGSRAPADTKGHLVVENPWPGMLLTLWGDDERYKSVYWSKYPGQYHTGDYAVEDKDGYLWILGRADDVLNVAGHRIGAAELENSIVSHIDVAESAVCGTPDDVKGEVITAFVVLREYVNKDHDILREEIIQRVRQDIGPIATPAQIFFVPGLPKTRSGKIMRRMLKSIVKNEGVGDTSTLEDGAAVNDAREAAGS